MPPTTRSKRKRQQTELDFNLRYAVWRGNITRVRELVELERVGVDSLDERGRTPLRYALLRGNLEVARFLLENGANANSQDEDGISLLLVTIIVDNAGFVELLIEYGADLESRKNGLTPLGRAISLGHREIASLLLQHGARTVAVYADDTDSLSALYLSCKDEAIEIVTLLLERFGVDVNQIQSIGS